MKSKPSSRIVCVGADGSGKTTLAAVLSFICAKRWGGVSLSPSKIKAQWHTASKSQSAYALIPYESEARAFSHVDYQDHQAILNGIFTEVPGSIDGVIWVVSYTGLKQQDLQQIKLLRALSLQPTVVFLNQAFGANYDAPLMDELEISARMMLAENDFNADEIPMIRGQVLLSKAAPQETVEPLLRLLDALEQKVDLQRPPPYLVSSAVSRKPFPEDAPIIFTGHMERGAFQEGETVELVGFETQQKTKIVKVESSASNYPGTWLRLTVEKITYQQSKPGQLLSTPGAFSLRKRATVLLQGESFQRPSQENERFLFRNVLEGTCFLHQLRLYWSINSFSLKDNIGTVKHDVSLRVLKNLEGLPAIFLAELTFPEAIALCKGERLLLNLYREGVFSAVVIDFA